LKFNDFSFSYSPWQEPSLTFSAYNAKGQLLERAKEFFKPSYSSLDTDLVNRENLWLRSDASGGEAAPAEVGSSDGGKASRHQSTTEVIKFYWGCQWHMSTPLQNLEEGSFVLIEMRDGGAGSSSEYPPSTVNSGCHWGRYPINFSTINSTVEELLGLQHIPYNSGSAANKRLMLSPTGTGSSDTTSLLFLDCTLHRRERNIKSWS
jgi:hypothetical protein